MWHLWGAFIAALWKDCGDSGGSVPQVPARGMSLEHCWAHQSCSALGLKGSDWPADTFSVRKNQCYQSKNPPNQLRVRGRSDAEMGSAWLTSWSQFCWSLSVFHWNHLDYPTYPLTQTKLDSGPGYLSTWVWFFCHIDTYCTALISGKRNSLLQQAVQVCTLLTFGPQSYSQSPYTNSRICLL